MLENLQQRVNADAWLVHRGRYVNTTFLFEAGADAWLIAIAEGRVESLKRGPFVMPRWTFALRAAVETWNTFWLPTPPPGYHDLFALLKFRRLTIDGDQYPFMCNLRYFKDVIASLRPSAS